MTRNLNQVVSGIFLTSRSSISSQINGDQPKTAILYYKDVRGFEGLLYQLHPFCICAVEVGCYDAIVGGGRGTTIRVTAVCPRLMSSRRARVVRRLRADHRFVIGRCVSAGRRVGPDRRLQAANSSVASPTGLEPVTLCLEGRCV